MAKCSFCGENLAAGKGKTFVRTTGQVLHFCGSKCQRNWNLGRQGKTTRWTRKSKEA